MHGTTTRAEARERTEETPAQNTNDSCSDIRSLNAQKREPEKAGSRIRCACGDYAEGYDARRDEPVCEACAELPIAVADGGRDPTSTVAYLENADQQLRRGYESLDDDDEWSKGCIGALRSDLDTVIKGLSDDEQEIVTDGGRDSPKGALRITLDRDDINALLDSGTKVVEKDVGPITVNLRTHQQLNAVVTVSGRRKDPDPEVVKDD